MVILDWISYVWTIIKPLHWVDAFFTLSLSETFLGTIVEWVTPDCVQFFQVFYCYFFTECFSYINDNHFYYFVFLLVYNNGVSSTKVPIFLSNLLIYNTISFPFGCFVTTLATSVFNTSLTRFKEWKGLSNQYLEAGK